MREQSGEPVGVRMDPSRRSVAAGIADARRLVGSYPDDQWLLGFFRELSWVAARMGWSNDPSGGAARPRPVRVPESSVPDTLEELLEYEEE